MDEKTKTLKAYIVSCDDDDHGMQIVFAGKGSAVDKSSNAEACDCRFVERRVRRAEKFDKYAPGPVTARQFMAEGGYYPCAGCERPVYADDDPVITGGDRVFCSAKCLYELMAAYRKLGDKVHQSILDAVADMERYVSSRATANADPGLADADGDGGEE